MVEAIIRPFAQKSIILYYIIYYEYFNQIIIPVTWMFHSRKSNNRINRIDKIGLKNKFTMITQQVLKTSYL